MLTSAKKTVIMAKITSIIEEFWFDSNVGELNKTTSFEEFIGLYFR